MSRFGFVGPTYQSQSPNAAADLTMNWYTETIEVSGGKSGLALYPSPGLQVFTTLSGPSVRGEYIINGRFFAVSGANFYEIASNGVATKKGTLLNDSLPVSMIASPQQLLIASAGALYVFQLQTATNSLGLTASQFAQIAPPTFNGLVSLVSFIDGFFLVLILNSQQIYASTPFDATSWPGLSTTLVSVFPDNVLSFIATHRQLALFGLKASVTYYDSGNFPFPFDVVPGGEMEQGTIARFSPVNLDNSVFWIGGDDRGNAIAWRANGYTPQRVSTHAVEFAWQGYPKVSDAISYTFQDQGHSFWHIYFPSANQSWRYDVATGMWHQVGFWKETTASYEAHHSQCHAFAFGKHLVGDWNSGNIYQMAIPSYSAGSWLFADDNGNPIRRVRRAPHIAVENEWIFHHQFQLDMETGLGPVPSLPGTSSASVIILQDSGLVNWAVTLTSAGLLQTTVTSPAATPQTLFINDPTSATTWQVKVTTLGLLTTTAVALQPATATFVPMVSAAPSFLWNLQVTLAGLLQTVKQGVAFPRDPQINLRWSDDAGHTWSNEYARSAGGAGNYKTRVIWRRLGRARIRTYEVNCSDPVPFRLIDAYLLATPGFQPQERISKQYQKVA